MQFIYQQNEYSYESSEFSEKMYVEGHNEIMGVLSDLKTTSAERTETISAAEQIFFAEESVGKYLSKSTTLGKVSYCRDFKDILDTERRVSCSFHKYVKNILKLKIKDDVLTYISNKFLSFLKHTVYDAPEIHKQYMRLSNEYSLTSCMTSSHASKSYEVLVHTGVKLHVVEDSVNKKACRCLVWEDVLDDEFQCLEDTVVLDRMYQVGNLFDDMKCALTGYYHQKAVIFRNHNSMFCAGSSYPYDRTYCVKLFVDDINRNSYPFMDSFCYVGKDKKLDFMSYLVCPTFVELPCSDKFQELYNIQSTNGNYESAYCLDCGRLLSYNSREGEYCDSCAHHDVCAECGVLLYDEYMEHGCELFCYACYHETFSICSDCGEAYLTSDLISVEGGHGHLCRDCLCNYTYCEECSEYRTNDSIHRLNNRDTCSECLAIAERTKDIEHCSLCNEYYETEYLKGLGDKNYCCACYSYQIEQIKKGEIKECSECHEIKEKDALIHWNDNEICFGCLRKELDKVSTVKCSKCSEHHLIDVISNINGKIYCKDCASCLNEAHKSDAFDIFDYIRETHIQG